MFLLLQSHSHERPQRVPGLEAIKSVKLDRVAPMTSGGWGGEQLERPAEITAISPRPLPTPPFFLRNFPQELSDLLIVIFGARDTGRHPGLRDNSKLPITSTSDNY